MYLRHSAVFSSFSSLFRNYEGVTAARCQGTDAELCRLKTKMGIKARPSLGSPPNFGSRP